MEIGDRLGAGIGEKQPGRRRSLRGSQSLGQIEPVYGDLFPRHCENGGRRRGQGFAGLAAKDDLIGIEQQPAGRRTLLVEEDQSRLGRSGFSC